ncbi:MAG: fibronectin type III domain-containing protein, partial [Bacteroidales bacterium]|nr:fibronectin type III domain-containing protein [Bacteroidales bacterium]
MKKLYSFLMLALTLALGAANAHAQSITVSSYEISAGVEGYDGTLYVSFGYDISEYRPDLQFYADGITPVEMGAYSWLSATFRNDNYDELRCGFGNNPGIARTAYLRVVLRDNAYPYAVIDSSDLITIYQEGADCPAPDHLALTEGSITQKGGSFTWTGYTNEYWMYIDLVEEADEGRLFTANFNEESLPSNENGYFINNSFSWGDTEGVITASNPNLGCIKSDNYLWDGTATLELYMFSKGYPTLISFEAMLLAGGNNKGSFWIDGIKVLELSGGDFQTKDWSHYTFELSAYYPHTLEWKFTKSDDPQYVDDAFFIDDILIYKYTEAYSYDPVHVYSNNVTLNDLGWGYTYRAYVQGVCPEVYDEQWGYWYSPQTGSSNYVFFTTAVECQKPDHLTATNMTGSSTDISWAGYGYDHFDIYCATEDLSNVNFRRVTGTCSSTITGLSPNTTYKVWLETTCEASMQKGNSTRGTMILISDTLLITTNCGAALPYFEDFENCAATTSDQVHYHSLPVCWESYNETFNDTWYDGYPTVMLTDSVSRYSYSGEQLLCLKSRYASSVTNTDQYAILPAMGTVPVNTLQLSFYACRGRDNYNNIPLYVGVMSDPEDIGTFELFKTIEITGVNTDVWGNDYDGYWYHGYNQYTVDFSNYTGQGKYIAFMMERATSSYEPKAIYIDDISCVSSVVPSSTCPTPTGLTASNVTTTSADLSWNSENGISSYNVEYREGASMNSTFFEEPFNNSGISWSWDQYSGLVDDVLAGTTELTYSSVWGTSSNALGAYSAKINIYGDERMGWLVTPETTLPTDAALTFDLALTSYNSSNAASTTGNDDRFVVLAYADGHWTKLREWNNSGSSYVFNDIATTGENVFIDLSAYGNKNVKIAFYGESTQYNGDNDLHIDNVTLGTASGAGEWQSAAENTHNTSAEITGLTPDTRYEVRVRCNCAGEDVSDWSELFTFNTPPSCPTVSQLEVLQVTNSTATITWREGGDESSWDIYVTTDINDVPNASTTPTEEYTDYNPYLVENLSPATTYYIYVRAVCDEYEKSEWSIPAVAMTKCEAMTLPYTYGFEDNQEFLYCWSYIKEGYHSIYTVNSNPHDGNSSLYLYRSSASNTLIAILPEVQANYNLKNYEISLYAKMVAPQETFAGTLHVGIMTDPNDASSFVQVGENITMTTDYAQYSVNLNSYTGNGHYIAIKVTSGSWGYLYIDDINVSQTTQGTHTVSVTSNSTEGGTVTGAGTYNDGETVTLSATPTPCYHFVNWTVNGVEVSTEAIYSFTVTDDAVYMANFELNQSTGIFDEQTACGSFTWIDGVTYTESGYYFYSHEDDNGCTKIDTLHLTIYNPTHTAITKTACGSYTWNGTAYTESGTYTYSHEDSHGCTQIDTLYLTINNATTGIDEQEACGSYTWIDGTTYNESTDEPTFTIENGSANGCDSIVTLHLTIHNPAHTATTETACGSYKWANGDGQTYDQSDTYTYSHEDANGCTQVDTLYLTINNPVNEVTTVVECGSYTWNGTAYTESGTYTYSHEDGNGCTQVDTLYLTINLPTTGIDEKEACGSYTWIDGTTYNESTDEPTFTIENGSANGCDSIVTLHLTIYNPVNEVSTASAVETYTWNNQTYTQSGTYTYNHEDDHGCTQVDTLYLTVYHASADEFAATACESYTWNNETYT